MPDLNSVLGNVDREKSKSDQQQRRPNECVDSTAKHKSDTPGFVGIVNAISLASSATSVIYL